MSSASNDQEKLKRKLPAYQTVDGFKIPSYFSAEAFRSALAYNASPGDLFIVTYPKCGTTWVQNIVACIYRGGKPFDSYLEFMAQTPFLELAGAEAATMMKKEGGIKTHLPFHLAPWSSEAKYIFVARNPKDCCVSFYHHTVHLSGYNFEDGRFEDYFDLFIEGQTDFGDYFDTTMSWYEHRHDPNVFFITYEELKKDTKQNILRIAEFLGLQYKEDLVRDEKLLEDVLCNSSFSFMKEHFNKQMADTRHLSKEEIQNNKALSPGIKDFFAKKKDRHKKDRTQFHFVRKGAVGDWKNHFSPEQNAKLEKKFLEKMGNTELAEMWKEVMNSNEVLIV